MIDPEKLKILATEKYKENKTLIQKLKKKRPKNLDQVAGELHDNAFEKIDCLTCANCCKTISPFLIDRDIQRIASHLRMKPSDFVVKYLYVDKDNDYVFKETPCPFLMEDNYCAIYENRPRACREYPHTDRKRLVNILDLTLKNTFTCPAVYEVVKGLGEEYG
ncbi:MAG: YkgJ family cysteine cluster protein [Bacteroidales bacterium]|nr:YkgJ family cysteine cluster protein [Bacteroidales bacterium]MCF8391121.1 YkgJ family cysteine cluster protein [Bacteroidales bacterium]